MDSFSTRVAEIIDLFFDENIEFKTGSSSGQILRIHRLRVVAMDATALERENKLWYFLLDHNTAYIQIAREVLSIVWYYYDWQGYKNNPYLTAARKLANEVRLLLIGKHSDYGTKNMLRYKRRRKNELALLIRLRDKTARALNLISHNQEPNYESILDTLKDIIGYCVLAIMMREGTLTDNGQDK